MGRAKKEMENAVSSAKAVVDGYGNWVVDVGRR